ncbi:MAG TPA: hypothetical protein DF383_03330 [Deltaproteobacteria bacterium]|nr:hypothetical protein [Deltaproteobacteria bacterium]
MASSRTKWLPICLNIFLLPGAGQWYLKKRFKGGMLMALSLFLLLGGLSRYLALVFAVVNRRGATRPPSFNLLPVLHEAWRLDHRVFIWFLVALLSLWILSILDVWAIQKESDS